ncbi:membrane-associated phospholipid phosphatase [Arthrobacter globiformis]|uniref:phosphatase PAP2 family protein n=1 Tax=Arthrobacter globiformis TaxID=1665 RepID=UPI002783547D|nr:phosphatase PAP2 family protein [Arthrobacter globiformis]MDQ1060206.1 membrane-associated phospholipid phosphatase [Arthrobacter globiformis]
MAEETAGKQGRWRVFHDKFVVEERYMEPGARKGLYVTALVLALVGAAIFLATLAGVLQHDGLASADGAAQKWLLTTRSDALTVVMVVLAVIFGPVGLPIIVLVVTVAWGVLAKHAWRPILLAAAMLTGVGLAQLIGRSVERQRPPVDLMLFGADHTFSFPSGHVLGASDFLLVTTFLVFSRHRNPKAAVVSFVVAVIGVFLASISRLYLGYHWVSDAVASVSLSLVVLGAVIAVDTWRTARVPGEQVTGELSKADVPD